MKKRSSVLISILAIIAVVINLVSAVLEFSGASQSVEIIYGVFSILAAIEVSWVFIMLRKRSFHSLSKVHKVLFILGLLLALFDVIFGVFVYLIITGLGNSSAGLGI